MNSFRLCFFSSLSLLASAACGDSTGPGGSGGSGAEGASGGAGATGGTGANGGEGTGANGGSGASQQGGAGGTSDGGAGTGGGIIAASPECTENGDCFINSDCCECAGRPIGEDPPACAIDCFEDICSSLGIQGGSGHAQCVAGRCVTEASCDDTNIGCAIPSPRCQPGTAPIVAGFCYTGDCLDVLECNAVSSCGACAGATDAACVNDVAQLPSFHCVDLATCANADCQCLGPSVCIGSFDICNEIADGVECSCPTCTF